MIDYEVAVFSHSNRKMDYHDLLNFYQYRLFDNIDDFSGHYKNNVYNLLAILDYNSVDDALMLANWLREYNPYIQLIIIHDLYYKGDIHKDISKINGLGQTKFVAYYKTYDFQLMHHIEAFMHPQASNQLSEIAVAIPVFNEESRIQYVKSFMMKLADLIANGHYGITVYLIDDGSDDTTVSNIMSVIAEQLEENDIVYWKQPLTMHRLVKNTRKAGTYLDAFSSIDAEYIVTVDADDSFQIEDIVKMIHQIKLGYYDIIIGTKDQSTETRTLARRLLSKGKRLLTNRFLPKGVSDSQTGLKVFKKSAIYILLPFLEVEYGLAIDLQIMYLAKKMYLRVRQISVTIIDREGSHINIVSDTIKFLKSMAKIALHQDYRKWV